MNRWGTDMTKFYIEAVGWVYLAFVLDWYMKKMISYKMGLKPVMSITSGTVLFGGDIGNTTDHHQSNRQHRS